MSKGQIRISFWFFAMAAVCVLAGHDVLMLLVGALLHELGHLAAMLCFGARLSELEVGPLGAKIHPHYRGIPSTAQELIVLAAGPLVGIIAGLVASQLGFLPFARLNWFLSAFNLLPMPGLDGGSMLTLLLCKCIGERGEVVAKLFSVLCLVVFLGLCAATFFAI